jgi:hypothetical protein
MIRGCSTPLSDLSRSKLRPAVVLAEAGRGGQAGAAARSAHGQRHVHHSRRIAPPCPDLPFGPTRCRPWPMSNVRWDGATKARHGLCTGPRIAWGWPTRCGHHTEKWRSPRARSTTRTPSPTPSPTSAEYRWPQHRQTARSAPPPLKPAVLPPVTDVSLDRGPAPSSCRSGVSPRRIEPQTTSQSAGRIATLRCAARITMCTRRSRGRVIRPTHHASRSGRQPTVSTCWNANNCLRT